MMGVVFPEACWAKQVCSVISNVHSWPYCTGNSKYSVCTLMWQPVKTVVAVCGISTSPSS